MAKFYVQSGTLQTVVDAQEPDRAALWAVHQVLAQVLPVFDDDDLSAQEKQAVATFRGTLVLDDQVRVSNCGKDHDDASTFQTANLVREWGQLVIALQKIEELSQENPASDPQPCEELCLAV